MVQHLEAEEPQPKQCTFCDFASGYRGMDRCRHCDGTGSIFWVGKRCFPNTKEGYEAAKAHLIEMG